MDLDCPPTSFRLCLSLLQPRMSVLIVAVLAGEIRSNVVHVAPRSVVIGSARRLQVSVTIRFTPFLDSFSPLHAFHIHGSSPMTTSCDSTLHLDLGRICALSRPDGHSHGHSCWVGSVPQEKRLRIVECLHQRPKLPCAHLGTRNIR